MMMCVDLVGAVLSVCPVVTLCDSVILSHVDFLVLSRGAHDVFAVYACARHAIIISCYDLCLYVAFGSRTVIGPLSVKSG